MALLVPLFQIGISVYLKIKYLLRTGGSNLHVVRPGLIRQSVGRGKWRVQACQKSGDMLPQEKFVIQFNYRRLLLLASETTDEETSPHISS